MKEGREGGREEGKGRRRERERMGGMEKGEERRERSEKRQVRIEGACRESKGRGDENNDRKI